jgi:hypothetical protein
MMVKSKTFIDECFGVKSKGEKIYSEGYMDTVIARAIAWQVYKRSVPAALHISKKENERKTTPFLNPILGNEFQTLDKKPIGIHKKRDNKRTARAPWEV